MYSGARTTAFVFFCLTLTECWLVGAIHSGALDFLAAASLHLIIMTAAAVVVGASALRDRIYVSIGLMSTLLTGPFGAAGSLVTILWLRRTTALKDAAALQAWYDKLAGREEQDNASEIYASLTEGRAMQPTTKAVPNFSRLLNEAAEEEQHAILGIIGLKYHPHYLPILQQGLSSDTASVRVQAAAVFAKLREAFKEKLKSSLSKAKDIGKREPPSGSLSLTRDLDECLQSGFLDRVELRAGRAALIESCQQALETGQLKANDEVFLYSALSLADAHDIIVRLLTPQVQTRSDDLHRFYCKSLMHLGRSGDLARALGSKAARRDQHPTSRATGLCEMVSCSRLQAD